MRAETRFALAAAVHAGFQLTVTTLVYPALVEVDEAHWATAHDRHSRRITPVVAVVYGGLLATGAALAVARPDAAGRVGLAATAGALAVTATAAAPLHGRLARDPAPALKARLLRVDRVRCALAVVGAGAALRASARA